MKIITLGSDPEFACYDTKLQKFISLVDKFSGTKEKPSEIEAIKGCCNLIDCCGLEFTIPPCQSLGQVYDYIDRLIKYHNIELKKINPDWQLKVTSSARYDDDQLQSEQSTTFGCEPSWSIYKGESKVSVENAGNIRSYGFHLHFGFDQELSSKDIHDFVFLCDLFLGLPSIIFDTDVLRRKIYGRLGDYRPKPAYPGLEYRVMGIGMYEHFNIINEGIHNIQYCLDNNMITELREEFYSRMLDLDNNLKMVNKLKAKKLYDDILCIWDVKEEVF